MERQMIDVNRTETKKTLERVCAVNDYICDTDALWYTWGVWPSYMQLVKAGLLSAVTINNRQSILRLTAAGRAALAK